MDFSPQPAANHSAAWVGFTQVNFAVMGSAVTLGIWHLEVDAWVRGFVGIGVLALVGATVTMTKTIRDVHESKRVIHKVEEAKVERLLMEHDNNFMPPPPSFTAGHDVQAATN